MSENYFFQRRSQKHATLYFKTWIRKIYFGTAESHAGLSLNAAIRRYETDLNEGIEQCKAKKDIKNLETAQSQFKSMKQVIIDVDYNNLCFSDDANYNAGMAVKHGPMQDSRCVLTPGTRC
jgi:hypothetical protein